MVAFIFGAGSLFTHGPRASALRIAGLFTALTGLTIGVQTHGWVTGLDATSTAWLGAHGSDEFDTAAWLITRLASPAASAVTGLICAALLSWWARSVVPGGVVIGTVTGAMLVETALKAVVARPPTPQEWRSLSDYVYPDGHSFPSGHVTGIAALLGIIAVCAARGRSRTTTAFLTGLVFVAVLLVAVTRIYIGAHWLSDVVGGAVLGALFVSLGATAIGAFYTRSGKAVPAQGHRGSAAHADPVFPQR